MYPIPQRHHVTRAIYRIDRRQIKESEQKRSNQDKMQLVRKFLENFDGSSLDALTTIALFDLIRSVGQQKIKW